MLGEPPTQGANAEALGRVVARGDVVDPVLRGLVEHPFGRLTGYIGVEARRYRLVVLAFGGPGDDPHRGDLTPVALEDLRFAIGCFRNRREKLLGVHRLGEDAADAGRCPLMLGERLELGETEAATEDGGVAQVHVAVEGEMVGDQGDVVGQQQPDSLAEAPGDPRRFTRIPQNAVVDDDGVGLTVDGAGEQSPRGGHSRHNPRHMTGALDLQTVGTVVPDGFDIEEFIEIGNELKEIHDEIVPQNGKVYGGTTVRIASTLRLLCLPGIAGLSILACSPAEAPKEKGFRVRLLTSVALSGRWEQAAEKGLGLIAAELEADVARTRATGSADQRALFRNLARDGVDLVFCVGPEVERLVYTEAVAFPDTDFVVIPGEIHGANVGSVTFAPEEAGYLAGAVAAAVTDRPAVGLLRGAGRPWLERLEAGFSAGFRSGHANAEVVTAGGLDGPWQLTGAGVEVALYSADRVDRQVLAAAHDAGLFLVGADPSLLEAEPDFVIAAVDVDVAEAMLRVAREVRDLTFTGKVYAFDLGSGVLDVQLNSSLAPTNRLTDYREALERARSEITAGWVEIEELGIGQ